MLVENSLSANIWPRLLLTTADVFGATDNEDQRMISELCRRKIISESVLAERTQGFVANDQKCQEYIDN